MLMAAIASASASASVAVRGHERKKPPSQFDEPPVVVDGEPVRATVAGVDGAPARGEAPLEELEDRDGRSSLRSRRCDLRAEPAMAAASVDRGFSTTWYVNACSASAEARASVMSAPSRSGCGAPGMRRVPSSHVPFCERSSTTWPPRPSAPPSGATRTEKWRCEMRLRAVASSLRPSTCSSAVSANVGSPGLSVPAKRSTAIGARALASHSRSSTCPRATTSGSAQYSASSSARLGTTLPEPRFSMSCRRVADDGAAGDSDDEKDDRSVSAEFATSATWSLTCLTREPGLLRLARKVAGEADIADWRWRRRRKVRRADEVDARSPRARPSEDASNGRLDVSRTVSSSEFERGATCAFI